MTDNRILMERQPDYVQQLEALPEKLRRAWLDGDWDVFEGQFFEDFRLSPDPAACAAAGLTQEEAKKQGRWTHVVPARPPAPGWKLYRSFDWGYSRPFSCAWWAVDFDGRLYDQLRPEDLDTTGEDHAADEWRYMCMARPITPQSAPTEKRASLDWGNPLGN